MVTPETLEEIRVRTDLVALIGARVTLKRTGSRFLGRCPFHAEKTPSFTVFADDQQFHCFGCQAHGDCFGFLMRHEGLAFMDAVRVLAEQAGVPLEQETDERSGARRELYALHRELAEFYRRCLLQTAEAARARNYLEKRGIDEVAADTFMVGYAPTRALTLETWARKHSIEPTLMIQAGLLSVRDEHNRAANAPTRYRDRFRGRLMFPIRDVQGRVIAFSGRLLDANARAPKYVNSPETPIFQKGSVLYGLDLARRAILNATRREALVCEGQIDVLRCHACGFERAIAAQGTAFTTEHVRLLNRYADSVVLVFDGDAAGGKAALRTAALMMDAGLVVRVANLPPGDDPDSLLRRDGSDAFQRYVEQAESVIGYLVRTMQAAETTPGAIDAVDRIARAVIEQLAACSNAVHRARLLQEAAELLGIPESALLEELERHKRQHPPPSRAPRTHTRAEPEVRHADAPDATPPATANHGNALIDAHAAAARSDPQAPLPPCPEEIALCELICQHEDELSVVNLIHHYLPPELVRHDPCRAIIEAAIRTQVTGEDALGELQAEGPTAVRCWIDRFATADHRVAGAREWTAEDAARDCILRLWRRHLREERDRLTSAPGKVPDATTRRLAISTLMRRLQSVSSDWDTVEPLLSREIRARSEGGPTAPDAHATDNEA